MRLGNAAVGDGSLVAAAVTLVVPALNEVEQLPALLADAASFPVDEIIVVDNGSTDATGDVARQMGATVVSESVRGNHGIALRQMATKATLLEAARFLPMRTSRSYWSANSASGGSSTSG